MERNKKIINQFLIFVGLSYFTAIQGWTLAYSKEIRNFREKVTIAPEIAGATTISELQTFLNSPEIKVRIATVRRLAQIGGRKAVESLVERFAKEAYIAVPEYRPYVKIEIIEALQKIGSEEAKLVLLDLLDLYIKHGSQCKCKVCKGEGIYPWHDGDYITVTPSLIKALYTWKNDEEISFLFQRIALDNKVRSWVVREMAYKFYLKTKMAKKGIITMRDSVMYLSELLTGTGTGHSYDWIKGETGIKTLEAIQNGAIVAILKEHSNSALLYLREKLGQVSDIDNPGRYEALNYIINYIEKRAVGSEN